MKAINVLPSLVICVTLVLILTLGGLYARQHLINIAQTRASIQVANSNVLDGVDFGDIDFNYWLTVDYDRPYAVEDCRGKVCYFGDKESDKVVVLLGQSHAAHYQAFFESMAHKYRFQLVTVITHPDSFNTIKKINPDFLISSGTVTAEPGSQKDERIAKEYSEIWNYFSKSGVPILLIRDTPRFNFYQNGCLWKKHTGNLKLNEDCTIKRSDIYKTTNPLKTFKEPGVSTIDFSDLVCDKTICFSELNGLPIYYDKHHFTNRFILSNSNKLLEEMKLQAPDFYESLAEQ